MSSDQKYLSEREVAEMLGIPTRTLQTWRLQRRILPFVKLGASVRYRLGDIEKYLQSAQVTVAM